MTRSFFPTVNDLLDETIRTLRVKLGWPLSLASYFPDALRAHFAEAWIVGYERLTARMPNDEKDRHVVAAAGSGRSIAHRNFQHETFQVGRPSAMGDPGTASAAFSHRALA